MKLIKHFFRGLLVICLISISAAAMVAFLWAASTLKSEDKDAIIMQQSWGGW